VSCSLRFRFPLPAKEELEAMYEDEIYHASPYFRAAPDHASARLPEVRIFERALGDLRTMTPAGRLLDVGCGTGLFLDLARKQGWRVCGVELSRALAERASRGADLEIWQGDFLAAPYPPGSFDVITMWDFLEHVLDPLAVLRRARNLLLPSGVLLVFTIDTSSLFNLAGNLLYAATGRRLRRPLELLYDARHNYYFSRQSLARVLDRAGFRVERWRRHRAYLGRWLSEPAPWYLLAGGFVIDLLSLPLNRPYRRTAYCRPKGD